MHAALHGPPSLTDLGDVQLDVVVELGRTRMPLRQARTLKAGDLITLDRLAGEAVQVYLNGHPFAEGETVWVTELLSTRLTHLLPPPEAQDEGAEGDEA